MTGSIEDKGKRGTPLERFWRYVSPGKPDECWLWQGALSNGGYGKFAYSRRYTTAHVASYLLFRGDLGGLCVLHTCDTRACVNPRHLWLGTLKDNAQDMVRKGRFHFHTHPERIPRGHRHTNANLTPEQVVEIRLLHAQGVAQLALAKQFAVSATAVWNIVHNLTYTNVDPVTQFPYAQE